MQIINLIQIQEINLPKRNLNKNKLFRSSVTNLRGVGFRSLGGFRCSVRNYHDTYTERYWIERDKAIEREEFNNKYKISWTKDYKNLNKMLSIKGLDSTKLIDENNLSYLVFSLTDNKHDLSTANDTKDVFKSPAWGTDIFYSVSLIIQSSGIKEWKQKLTI